MSYLFSFLRVKRVAIAIICYGITVSCQSPRDIEGEKHKITVDKWRELSRYSSSVLVNHGVFVSAKLSVFYENKYPRYQLTDISLANKEKVFSINLTYPSFENKYICTPVCAQLTEYMEVDSESSYTLLNQFLSNHEFELFDFYGKLYELNRRIERLEGLSSEQLSHYFSFLVTQNDSFANLKDFTQFLREKLTEQALKDYIRNPNRLVKSQTINPAQFLTADHSWQVGPTKDSQGWQMNNTEELEHWVVGPTLDSELWVVGPNLESEQWKVGQNEEIDLREQVSGYKATAESPNIYSQNDKFSRQPNKLIASKNDLVCSYSMNMFGHLVSMNDAQVEVSLIGEAKLLEDGVVKSPEKGFLHNQVGNVTFLPLSGVRSFDRSDIFVCFVK